MHDQDSDFSFKGLVTFLFASTEIRIITVVGTLIFFNMLFNGFIWDDFGFIIRQPVIHEVNIIRQFQENVFNDGGYYRPIPAVYFSVIYSIFGPQSFYFHFFQLSLHLADSILLFIFLRKFFNKSLSLVMDLIFLIHPIQVESVAFIGASQSELLFFFGMIAILISMRQKIRYRDLIVMSFFLLLSLLTKETSAIFICIILLYQGLFRKKGLVTFLPYIVGVVLCYLFIRLFLAHIPFEQNLSSPIGDLSLSHRFLNIPAIFFYYLKTFIFPAALGVDQRWIITMLNLKQFYLPLAIDLLFFVAVSVAAYKCYKKNSKTFRQFIFFSLWFFLGVGMLMQLVPLDMTVADRWFYLPIVGLLGMIGLCVSLIKATSPKLIPIVTIILVIWFALLGIRTIIRNTNWNNEITLFTHDVQTDDNYDLEYMLGTDLLGAGQYQLAIPHLEKSADIYPTPADYNNLGTAFLHAGDYTHALFFYKKALLLDSHYKQRDDNLTQYIYDNVVWTMTYKGNPHEAKIFLINNALSKFPNNGIYWGDLAYVCYFLHDQQNALKAAQKAKMLLHTPEVNNLYENILYNKEVSNPFENP